MIGRERLPPLPYLCVLLLSLDDAQICLGCVLIIDLLLSLVSCVEYMNSHDHLVMIILIALAVLLVPLAYAFHPRFCVSDVAPEYTWFYWEVSCPWVVVIGRSFFIIIFLLCLCYNGMLFFVSGPPYHAAAIDLAKSLAALERLKARQK